MRWMDKCAVMCLSHRLLANRVIDADVCLYLWDRCTSLDTDKDINKGLEGDGQLVIADILQINAYTFPSINQHPPSAGMQGPY